MTTLNTNLHQKILNEYLNSDIKIKSIDRLNEYIAYCIDNNQNKRILNENGYSKTSLHHILPKAKDCFPEFKDLKVNKWNGTHLLYSDHYYAHWLITEAIDSYSQLYAFCQMHNMDTKNGRINEIDLIQPDEFQEKMEERSRKQNEWSMNNPEKVKERAHRGVNTKNNRMYNNMTYKEYTSKLMSGSNNIVHLDGVVEKIRNTKLTTFIDGKNLDTISAERAAATMKMPDKNGITQYQKNGKKLSKTLKKIVFFEGKQITLKEQFGILRSRRQIKKGKVYKLMSIYYPNFVEYLYAAEIRNISAGLILCTKENYLGVINSSVLCNNNKKKYIGLYVEKVQNTETQMSDFDDIIFKTKYKEKFFIIKSVFDKNTYMKLTIVNARKISRVLVNKTKENYLGKNNQYQLKNKSYIGFYVDKIIYE